MGGVPTWTGSEANALRAAMRLSLRAFAEHLGVSFGAVASWNRRGGTVTPTPDMQAVLDTALARSSPEVQARFRAATAIADSGGADRGAAGRTGPSDAGTTRGRTVTGAEGVLTVQVNGQPAMLSWGAVADLARASAGDGDVLPTGAVEELGGGRGVPVERASPDLVVVATASLGEVAASKLWDEGQKNEVRSSDLSDPVGSEADDALVELPGEGQADYHAMQRRTVLRVLGALAVSPLPLVQWEALRHGMVSSLDPDIDWWDQTVAEYGNAWYRIPAEQIKESLRADLTVLQALIPVTVGSGRARLLSAAARLSVLVALNVHASGHALAAERWWRDAKRYADESGDADAVMLTRAWDVVSGCYDGRSPSRVVALGEDVLTLTRDRASAAACGLLAGHAQALSLAGRHADAVDTVQRLAATAEALPSAIVDDCESLWGWPEHRLRHTEAWVYAHAGRLDEATRAQEQAVGLYPATMPRLRTQVQLHHATAQVRAGHIPEGLRLAADVLDELPAALHNAVLRAVARQVVDAVPDAERQRESYRELVDRVPLTSVP